MSWSKAVVGGTVATIAGGLILSAVQRPPGPTGATASAPGQPLPTATTTSALAGPPSLRGTRPHSPQPPPEALALENDGTDPARPVLAPADEGTIDARAGWTWSDRCWRNIHAGKLGWAKAECLKGLESAPASPNPKASLLYNLGLIEKKAGNNASARRYFEQSLALREHPEVRSALESLP